jgi:outer membrane protein TolC
MNKKKLTGYALKPTITWHQSISRASHLPGFALGWVLAATIVLVQNQLGYADPQLPNPALARPQPANSQIAEPEQTNEQLTIQRSANKQNVEPQLPIPQPANPQLASKEAESAKSSSRQFNDDSLPDLQRQGLDKESLLKNFKPLRTPAEPQLNHQQNKTLSMSPIKLGALIQVAAMRPLRLEADYDTPISLAEALDYTMKNSLPIRIAHESVVFQEASLASQLADFLPSFSMSYTHTNSHVFPSTHSKSDVFVPRMSYPLFLGGNDFYTALAQYYRLRGWQETYKSNVNDALLDVYQKYTNLVLNHSLLKIRVKAVEVSKLQLSLNNEQFKAGSGTVFAIMQSRSQLAADKQALLAQQVATRQSSLLLGYALNMPLAANLVPDKEYLTEGSLINEHATIDELLNIAIIHRPELRQYEYFRYSAARNVQVAASNLYPTVSVSQTYNKSETTTTTSGSSGGNTTIEGAGIFGGLFNTYQQGGSVGYSLPNLGMNSVASIVSARALSRQSALQANQQLQLVNQQVRFDYITALTAREQIDNAAYGAESSAEALRLAELRLQSGLGTNLELMTAQRDYINALYSQAQAIVASNSAQAQLLHDLGVINVDTLLAGYHP